MGESVNNFGEYLEGPGVLINLSGGRFPLIENPFLPEMPYILAISYDPGPGVIKRRGRYVDLEKLYSAAVRCPIELLLYLAGPGYVLAFKDLRFLPSVFP